MPIIAIGISPINDKAAVASAPPVVVFTSATGGTITTDGDYKIHTFNSSDNFVVSTLGDAPNNVVEYLVVAGGGGGGGNDTAQG